VKDIKDTNYPLFRMVNDIALQNCENPRTTAEAMAYYDAFMRVYPYRIFTLVSWFKESLVLNPVEDLLRIGERVAEYVSHHDHHYHEEVQITLRPGKTATEDFLRLREGATSMAIDMGLLTAMYITQIESPDIRWHMRTRGRTFVDFQQVCVCGPEPYMFDPIRQPIGWCMSIADGKNTHRLWSEYFLMWLDIAEGRPPRSVQYV
jgi:hypothetical protein